MHKLQIIDLKTEIMNNTNTFNSADFAQFLLKTHIARQGKEKFIEGVKSAFDSCWIF